MKTVSIAKILVVNDARQVLTLTLSEHLKKPERSYLPDLPGGIVDQGETEQAAVTRELWEETGIIVPVTDCQLIYTNTEYSEAESISMIKSVFWVQLDHTPEVRLSWEHSRYSWVSVETLLRIDFRPFYNEAILYGIRHQLF